MAIFPWDINSFLNLPQEKRSNHTPLPEGHKHSPQANGNRNGHQTVLAFIYG
jgi:hypothetical protein